MIKEEIYSKTWIKEILSEVINPYVASLVDIGEGVLLDERTGKKFVVNDKHILSEI